MNILEQIRKGARLRKRVEASTAARDPQTVAVARLGQAIVDGTAGDFEESPIDLSEISSAYYTDSYIRRAVDKHSALMFKNGWELTGKNDQAVEYVWTRLKLMAEGTGQSIDAFLQEVGENLILYEAKKMSIWTNGQWRGHLFLFPYLLISQMNSQLYLYKQPLHHHYNSWVAETLIWIS